MGNERKGDIGVAVPVLCVIAAHTTKRGQHMVNNLAEEINKQKVF